MVDYIDNHRQEFGVEPICDALQIRSNTYYAFKGRPPSDRAVRDAIMGPILLALWTVNYKVYGARKLWKAALRDGHQIGRDQVARLMKAQGIRGIRRAKRYVTTRPDGSSRPPDLVDRNFTATRPNALWVTDLTHVATWQGVAYVCFIVDAFSRMIAGWRVAGHMRTDMSLTPSRWPAGPAAPSSKAWLPTPTLAASSPRSDTANDWQRSARSPRSARSRIALRQCLGRGGEFAVQSRGHPRSRPRAVAHHRGR